MKVLIYIYIIIIIEKKLAFKLCELHGFLLDIINELNSKDILQKLNCIELIEKVFYIFFFIHKYFFRFH